jgi:hypothetical protein
MNPTLLGCATTRCACRVQWLEAEKQSNGSKQESIARAEGHLRDRECIDPMKRLATR